MLHKWRDILSNWINCYNEEEKTVEQCVTVESLVNIISHLRKNLDESISSTLHASSVKEFITEKYPNFKYENGKIDIQNEDNLYVAASLLLFFVCVNSKDVDLKTAMCSKLSVDDQETILKFSKSLMECSKVSHTEVLNAIAEACGQDTASSTSISKHSASVAETPPALRSLHGDVRRLQAALDAERFDKTFLQDELSRMQLRLDNVSKDKEKYKLEILALKAKISLCYGGESNPHSQGDVDSESSKLSKQLQHLEAILERTQNELDDVQHEKELYKAKVDKLKHERDKWLTESQQETSRACQLTEDLNAERQKVQSLQELLEDLRHHQHLNRMDSSQLECDDPDASIASLPHNASVCSEACANVVEVQLSEERAKIVVLKQQIISLQDQIQKINKEAELERQSLESVIAEKDNDLLNLKHCINEEIEEKNNLKIYFDNELTKLNNTVNELDQKLKDANEHSKLTIEKNMQDIKALQDEKLSLIQSFSDKVTQLEGYSQKLKEELESEKNLISKLKEDYDNYIMKLKEKLLNRNNEVVELQNNISQQSEMIESLHLDLRNERESIKDLSDKLHNESRLKIAVEANLSTKSEEVEMVRKELEEILAVIHSLNQEIEKVNISYLNLNQRCSILEGNSTLLLQDQSKNSEIIELSLKINHFIEITTKERHNLLHDLDESKVAIHMLNTRIEDEIKFKSDLLQKFTQERNTNTVLEQEVTNLQSEVSNLIKKINHQEKTIDSLNNNLNKEREALEKISNDFKLTSEKLLKKVTLLADKENEIKFLKISIENKIIEFREEINNKESLIECLRNEYEIEKQTLQNKLDAKNIELADSTKNLLVSSDESIKLKKALDEKAKSFDELQQVLDSEASQFSLKLTESKETLNVLHNTYSKSTKGKDSQIKRLQAKINDFQKIVNTIENEKHNLFNRLDKEIKLKIKLAKEFESKHIIFDNITKQLKREITMNEISLSHLKTENNVLKEAIALNCEQINALKDAELLLKNTDSNKTAQIIELKKKVDELQSLTQEVEMKLKQEVDNRNQSVLALEAQNKQLKFNLEEDNTKHELTVKEKDRIIETTEDQFKTARLQLETLRKEYDNEKIDWEQTKLQIIECKDTKINKLMDDISELKLTCEHNFLEKERVREKLSKQLTELMKQKELDENENKKQIEHLTNQIFCKEINVQEIMTEKHDIVSELSIEKAARDMLESEKRHVTEETGSLAAEKNSFEHQTTILTQQILEEKQLRSTMEKEKESLSSEQIRILAELDQLTVLKNKLLEEKESVTQQLIEEKCAKELVEHEKQNLFESNQELQNLLAEEVKQKETLASLTESLTKNLTEVQVVYLELRKNHEYLNQNFTEVVSKNNELTKQTECLQIEINSLKQDLLNSKSLHEVLGNEKDLLKIEKDSLKKDLEEVKMSSIEFEMKKNDEIRKLKTINETYVAEIKEKHEELKKLSGELNYLNIDFKKRIEQHDEINKTLNMALEKIITKFRKDNVDNDVLDKLLSLDVSDSTMVHKCDTLFNIINVLTTELVIKKNLENDLKHENAAIKELRDLSNQKEMKILELQNEIKNLQKLIGEAKSELIKQTAEYNDIMETKARDLQQLNSENQSLNNELNDVKVQLDVKVHSLKEKLVDNENITDKLKKTYECQINNLNMMSNKLTHYLKDKSVELETARQEKDKLLATIEENNTVIKSLEEEVKYQKHYQDKLLNDFESERSAFANMVSVTESVMEDQKVTLTKSIAENLKAMDALQQENKNYKDLIETNNKEFNLKLNEKEVMVQDSMLKLTDMKQDKESLEKEIILLKTSVLHMDEVNSEIARKSQIIGELESKLQENTNQLEIVLKDNSALKSDIKDLSQKIENQKCETVKLTISLEEQNKRNDELETTIKEKAVEIKDLKERANDLVKQISDLVNEKNKLEGTHTVLECQIKDLQCEKDNFLKVKAELLKENKSLEALKMELEQEKIKLSNDKEVLEERKNNLLKERKDLTKEKHVLIRTNNNLVMKETMLVNTITYLEQERDKRINYIKEYETKQAEITKQNEEISVLKQENVKLTELIEEKHQVIAKLEQQITHELEENRQLRENSCNEKLSLEEHQAVSQKALSERQKDIIALEDEVKGLKAKLKSSDELISTLNLEITRKQQEYDYLKKDMTLKVEEMTSMKVKIENIETTLKQKDDLLIKMAREKDTIISSISKELVEEKSTREKCQSELESKTAIVYELKQRIEDIKAEEEILKMLRKENNQLVKAMGYKETFTAMSQERNSHPSSGREHHQVHTDSDTHTDITHTSTDSIKTINDLEKIIEDKNRTVTTLQSDISFLKTLIGESENKLLDVSKELELSKENYLQLSNQLKKLVHQKNEEIADLKKQISKMSINDTRASQIIKVSAKYQAIILKRIAEIKSNTVLKELTNLGNSNGENEMRLSLNTGTITMEELENFLETTDRHLRRCSDKQISLQKERDRLVEVNRINESEVINLKKFLTELSVGFKTFATVKEVYNQRLCKVVSLQRTVRREILSLDGHITEVAMCKLERGYAAIMQDLTECAFTLERWVERSIGRSISPEKIKQAFSSESDRASLASATYQNTSLEVQLEELENSFQKLLEEVLRAQKGEGAKTVQEVTVMEVRAEYEDKLNRMKAKMNQLYQEQIAKYKDRQKAEIAVLQIELQKTRERLTESSRAYEDHIKSLTTELWSVGEKFLMKKDEAEWLRRKQKSGSLMSLQHVHSSGLVPPQEDAGRPSDTQSLRSLPVNNNAKREDRNLHMSDEEGEVFDNRFLQDLSTPRRGGEQRLSELRWRNSLCPPHLKSSYPAETQFAPALHEEDIKCVVGGPAMSLGGRGQRKEVGITAYKKPGPPTPSKQAGRLSATDSELRESLRVENDPAAPRKTSTPSRLRSLFRSSKNDTTEGTPRSRRLSIFRRKQ